jgi:hypothetical protein
MAKKPKPDIKTEEEPDEYEWDYDADQGQGGVSSALGTFIDDLEGVPADAIDNYEPITLPDDGDDREAAPVYFEQAREGTALEHHAEIPPRARTKFWSYRHEFYEQMEFILVRFAKTELGGVWLTKQGWRFHLHTFAFSTPAPQTNMDLRHLSRRDRSAYYGKLDTIVLSEFSKIDAWLDDLRRCTAALLGESAAHVHRMVAHLTYEGATAAEGVLYRNACAKADTFLRDDEPSTTNWMLDALKTYDT